MTKTHPQNRPLGYARVSTYGQTLDAQLEQLRGARCTKIYREKVTGAHSDRRELLKMLAALAPDDVVTVTRIDRLARSTFDLFAIVKQIVDAKAQFRSLAEPWGHRHQHRTLDDCCSRRPRGCGARFDPHSHRRGPQPGAEARPAYGPSPEIDGRAAGRGPRTPGRGCHPRRARPQLPRGENHDFTAQMKSKEGKGFRHKFSVLKITPGGTDARDAARNHNAAARHPLPFCPRRQWPRHPYSRGGLCPGGPAV